MNPFWNDGTIAMATGRSGFAPLTCKHNHWQPTTQDPGNRTPVQQTITVGTS